MNLKVNLLTTTITMTTVWAAETLTGVQVKHRQIWIRVRSWAWRPPGLWILQLPKVRVILIDQNWQNWSNSTYEQNSQIISQIRPCQKKSQNSQNRPKLTKSVYSSFQKEAKPAKLTTLDQNRHFELNIDKNIDKYFDSIDQGSKIKNKENRKNMDVKI